MNIIETNLEFNSNISKRDLSRVKRQILHNSGVSVLQSIEVIHNYHKNTRGWAGIGYHFYVRKDGTIYEGRKVEYVGAHATNNNSDSIGICFEGNFNEETMPDVQKQAGKWLVSYLKEKYNANIVQAHRDVNNTSCPGTNFPFDEIANAVKVSETITTTSKKVDVLYQVYDNMRKAYLNEIKNYNESNDMGYAGIFKHSVGGLRVKLSNGAKVIIQAHSKNRNKWLSEITKWDNTSMGYAGIYGEEIDGIAMKAEGHTLRYRVHTINGKWLGWISKMDINDYHNGMAGAYGKAIDAIQIQVL